MTVVMWYVCSDVLMMMSIASLLYSVFTVRKVYLHDQFWIDCGSVHVKYLINRFTLREQID